VTQDKINVTHITPHLSGGLARVILSTLKYTRMSSSVMKHEIITLEELTPGTLELFKEYRDCIHVNKSWDFIRLKIDQADIVQLEWWNHPLIYKLLFLFEFPASRILLCSHVSGFYRPQIINTNVPEFADIFLATTEATRSHPVFAAGSEGGLNQKLHVITFPVDVDRLRSIQFKAHDDFNVGYIGTLNYAKLHKNFLKMSDSVKIPNVKFIVCGVDDNGQIEEEAKQYHKEKFKFVGYQADIRPVYEILDVFAYPLDDKHFGSGEQAIIEAMYAGIPVVAFSNPAEKEIIVNNKTGLLADNEREYVEAIEYLYQHPEERLRMGRNAKEHAEEHLRPESCFRDLESVYREILLFPKRVRKFKGLHKELLIQDPSDPDLGAKLFIESLGMEGDEFLKSYMHESELDMKEYSEKIANVEPGMKTPTKGSVCQYQNFFPNDTFLRFWNSLVKQKI
jgi:glycosyltransferase involved in cell wall biosynthesis